MDGKLADNLIRLIDDSATNGVPEIHFRFWRRADETARDEYIEAFRSDSDAMAWFADGYLGDDPDYDALLALHPDTLGYQYARHIVDNNLHERWPAITATSTNRWTLPAASTACPQK